MNTPFEPEPACTIHNTVHVLETLQKRVSSPKRKFKNQEKAKGGGGEEDQSSNDQYISVYYAYNGCNLHK